MIPAIIIARGGSVRLKRKNVLPFCGRPLVAWSLMQARHSKLIDSVWLSTDDVEIAAKAHEYGSHVIIRPDWPDPDSMSAIPVIKHALSTIERQCIFDTFVVLLPTSPIRKPGDLDGMIELYNKGTKDVIPLYNPKETLVYKRVLPDLCSMYLFDKNYRYLTQAGGCSVHDKEGWLHSTEEAPDTDKKMDESLEKNVDGVKLLHYYPLEWYQQFDIDDKDDFELCEILMERYVLKGRGAEVYER